MPTPVDYDLMTPEEYGMLPLEEKRYFAKFWTKGESSGIAMGIAKGRAEALVLNLRERFGSVPEPITERIRSASREQLDDWNRVALAAGGLNDIFDSPGAH